MSIRTVGTGIVIAFEGIDQSGKQTQVEKLASKLERAQVISFPDYDTPTGRVIKEMLYGIAPWDPVVFQSLMVINRYEKQMYIANLLQFDYAVILDRYSDSSVVYGETDGLDPLWLNKIQDSLIKPDFMFYLDITAEESFKRKGKDRDAYESNFDKLNKARQLYLERATMGIYNGMKIDGMKDPKDIHDQIIRNLREHLAEDRFK